VLSLKTLKTHTSKWTTLSQHAKHVMPYIDTDRENIIMDLDNCLLQCDGINKDTATKDQWALAFDKSYRARKGRNGGLIKLFGIKLADTTPSELFLESELDGTNFFGSSNCQCMRWSLHLLRTRLESRTRNLPRHFP
jgi:hypothetical protein